MKKPIRVLIADENPLYRLGIKTVLQRRPGILLTGETNSGATAAELAEMHQPDIVLIDFAAPSPKAGETARLIRMRSPETSIIVVSDSTDKNHVLEMIHAGATGYILKRSSKDQLLDAIYTVANNLPYYATEVEHILLQHTGHSHFTTKTRLSPLEKFTLTERRIIELICRQHTTKEIANLLCLGVRTIEGYRKHIEEKMAVRNTAGLVIYAITWNLFILPAL